MSEDPRVEVLRQLSASMSLGGVEAWMPLLEALDAADAAAKIARVQIVRFQGEPVRDADGYFLGFTPANDLDHEHRTVGPHRAWCYRDSEWCYPRAPCAGCGPAYEALEPEEEQDGEEQDAEEPK